MLEVISPQQKLPVLSGRVFGFIPTASEFDAFVSALRAAGVDESHIIWFHGEGSKELMHQNRGTFFLGDAEQSLLDLAAQQLDAGQYAISIGVADRDQAMRLAKLAERYGGHSFSHYGTWVNERLTK